MPDPLRITHDADGTLDEIVAHGADVLVGKAEESRTERNKMKGSE